MVNPNQIRNQLASYLASELSFEHFEDWLIQQSYNMHKDSSREAQELVHEINASIYEYLDDLIDESRLKSRWQGFNVFKFKH